MSDPTLAIVLGLSAYILSNLGMAIQKQGAPGLPRFKDFPADRQVRRWLAWWTLGTLMTIGGVALLFPALAMGKASVIASFGGAGLAALVLFSWGVLKEPIGRAEIAGVTLIAVGTALAGFLGGNDSAMDVFEPSWMLGYGAALIILAVPLSTGAVRAGRLPGLALGATSGTLAGLGIMLQKVVGDRAGAVTGLGGQVWAGLTDPYLVGWLVLTAAAFAVIQLAYLHGKAVTVVPAYTTGTIVVPIAGAAVVFGEELTPALLAGLCLLLIGVALLGGGAAGPQTEGILDEQDL